MVLIVEIDETDCTQKAKHGRGRALHREKVFVFGIVDRETGWCRLHVVSNNETDTLLPLIQLYVTPGACINSDMASMYFVLGDFGYRSEMVNHTYTFKDSESGCHSNTIECTFGLVKCYTSLPRLSKNEYFTVECQRKRRSSARQRPRSRTRWHETVKYEC